MPIETKVVIVVPKEFMKIKKMYVRLSLAVILFAVPGFSQIFSYKAPVLTISSNADIPAPYKSRVETALNEAFQGPFNTLVDSINDAFAGLESQKKLAHGFANANAYSIHSGTLFGYQNYRLFAISGGIMLGGQLPTFDPNGLLDEARNLQKSGDSYLGLGVGFNVAAAVNAGFLLDNLSLAVKYGQFNGNLGNNSFDYQMYGVGANYSLFDSKSLLGLVKWRGISLGTGLYHQSTEVKLDVGGPEVREPLPMKDGIMAAAADSVDSAGFAAAITELGLDTDPVMTIAPELGLGFDIEMTTIPLEASTALSFFFGVLNLSAGAGVDLNMGSADVSLNPRTTLTTTVDEEAKIEISEGDVSVIAGDEEGPSFARPRIMAGVGLGVGPVSADIPVIYYPATGFAVGLSLVIAM